jgi:hypothetical protein
VISQRAVFVRRIVAEFKHGIVTAIEKKIVLKIIYGGAVAF